jgi:hypothetical protein
MSSGLPLKRYIARCGWQVAIVPNGDIARQLEIKRETGRLTFHLDHIATLAVDCVP